MKPELNLLAAVFNEIESKYRTVKKQLEITADTSIEEGVKSEDKTITENLKWGEEIKSQYLETSQKYAVIKRNLVPLIINLNTYENTVILGAVGEAVKQWETTYVMS